MARRTRAPGELELVRSFLNTAALAEGRERLGESGDLAAWLRGRELLARVEAVGAACGLRPRFERDGAVSLAPEVGGVGGALGRLLGIVVAALPGDGWA